MRSPIRCVRARLLAAAWLCLFFAATLFGAEEQAPTEPLLSHVRQLTFAGRRSGEGYFNKDGKKLVFQSEREKGNPFYQIYLMDLETGDVRRVSTGLGKTTCAWIHPDGTKVLFSSTHLDPEAQNKQKAELEERAKGTAKRYSWDYDENYDLFVVCLDGKDPQRLAPALGYDAEGSFSPDGKKIVFTSNRHAYAEQEKLSEEDKKRLAADPSYFLDLYIMDADGANPTRLTDTPGYDGGPFFSADGKRICWRRFTPDGAKAEIMVMDADGKNQKALTKLGAMSWAPYFHPSGDYLIFTTNIHGFDNFELYMVDAEGKHEPVRVTTTPGFDGLPVFSPDGKSLAWTTSRTPKKQAQIFLANWDHRHALFALGLGPTVDGPPVFTPMTVAAETTLPEICAEDIRKHVEALCSDAMTGRLTGTEGEKLATEYVQQRFQQFGLSPAGENGTFFQEFGFTAGVSLGEGNALAAEWTTADKETKKDDYKPDETWRPLSFSATGAVEAAPVVFAGYGMVVPDAPSAKGADSYVHLDVKDKWVLVFRYLPENITPELRQHWARFSDLRYKALQARDRGAKGLIVVTGPNAQAKSSLTKLGLDAVAAGSSLPVISVLDEVAAPWLKASGEDLKALQDKLDTGEQQMGIELKGVKVRASINLVREKRTGRNVLARLQAGEKPSAAAVLIGAHVDHLGHGIEAYSLAKEDEKGKIHYGADDNASGVAAMLEIAEFFANLKKEGKLALKEDVLFAAWSGEEMGLLGSSEFAHAMGESEKADPKGPTKLQGAISACLNMDMVGRARPTLILNGLGSAEEWAGIVERCDAGLGVPIVPIDDSYVPTDATTFFVRGVPILSAFTGNHPEYHTPRDRPETLNYPGAADVARFMARVAAELASREDKLVYIAAKKPENAGRAVMRAYLGTVPDYAAEVQGVKLSGVTKGAPADVAGVKAGDVIVELAGKKIENVYDYTYAIAALKIGQKSKMVVVRNGEKVTLEVVPGSRE
ncbi:MAG: M28 family peptidase [Planctomycetes bacterium]|nr:M28 family peptidase [Planctomycetota bacterium]